MGKRKKGPKKKAIPEGTGSSGSEAADPSPCLSSREAAGAAKDVTVANRQCINCDNCGIANPQKCCARCLCYYYCSKECQLRHWKDHKSCCTALKSKRDHYNAAQDKNNLPGGPQAVIEGPCAICLEEEVKNPVRFECGHAFCFKCVFIYQSEKKQSSCPYCRGEIPNLFEKAGDRINLYCRRTEGAEEGSEERKRYYDLAMAEWDACSQISKSQFYLFFVKAQIVVLSNDPEELLKVTGEILSGVESRHWKFEREKVDRAKLWQARAYLEMGRWTDASKVYLELRKEVQLSIPWNQFSLEMGHCRCLFELGDYCEAVESGSRAVNLGRMYPGVHECLALAQKAAGNIDAARETMSRAILHEQQWNVQNLERNKQILRDL